MRKRIKAKLLLALFVLSGVASTINSVEVCASSDDDEAYRRLGDLTESNVRILNEGIESSGFLKVEARNELGKEMLQAASVKNWEQVKRLIKAGANVNLQNDKGYTVLHFAVSDPRRENLSVVECLLDVKGINLNLKDTEYGKTPLYFAVSNGHENVVRRLCEQGADVNEPSKEGVVPVVSAARHGRIDIMKILLDHNADVSGLNNHHITPLHQAARDGHKDIIELLVGRKFVDVNAVDVNAVDDDGNTALHYAVNCQQWYAVNKLIELGADVNAKNNDGDTPLIFAARLGRNDIVKKLCEHGAAADINHVDGFGKTVLHYMVGHLNYMPPLSYKERLHVMTFYESQISRIISLGANVKIQDKSGNTPLHYAAMTGLGECVVGDLVRAGAEVNIENNDGKTPLDCAIESESEGTAKYLREHGGIAKKH